MNEAKWLAWLGFWLVRVMQVVEGGQKRYFGVRISSECPLVMGRGVKIFPGSGMDMEFFA